MLKKSLVVFVLACMAVFVVTSAFAATASLSIATGGTAGTYYPIGGAIAAAASKHPDIRATSETGNAAVANTNLVAKGDIEIAFSQADVTAWAYNGELMFEKPLANLRTIAALYPETLHVVLAGGSTIKSPLGLVGKRVGVGAPGSGTEGDARAIFDTVGITYDDMQTQYLDFSGIASRFRDNQIDGGFVVAGVPAAALVDLATTKNITLMNFDKSMLDAIIAKYPFFQPNVIPKGTYRGVDVDISTPAVMALLITNAEMSEEVIYNFTKSMFENIDDVQKSHAMARNITLKTAVNGLTAPLHPGAEKYYKEKGILK